MKFHVMFVFLLTLIPFNSFSQPMEDVREKLQLLKSGKTNVEEFVNNNLNSAWHVDTVMRTIEISSVLFTYDPYHSASYHRKYFFDTLDNIDSILEIETNLVRNFSKPSKTDTLIDTTIIIYSYPLLKSFILNFRMYSIKKGIRDLFRTDYFGYDPEKRIVLQIQDEGEVQFFFTYNDKGEIEKETVLDSTLAFKYDDKGRLSSSSSIRSQVYYEYFDNSLLKKKKFEGNYPAVHTYEYK